VRRIAIIAAGCVAGWLIVLFVLGLALGSRQARHTKDRLAESLQATVTLGDSELALIRGRWSIGRLAVRHDAAIGRLALDVASVRCELAPLGWALLDRDCRELAVAGVRLEVSSTALFKQKRPKQPPVRAERVIIDDAVLVFLPTAFAPNLGRMEVAIEHAESGPTVLRTPLSWLFSLEVLRAKLALPAGITLHLGYQQGMLTAAGSLFGSSPVAVPLQLPLASAARDAHDEMQQLLQIGKDIAERLVAKRATDWIEQKLKGSSGSASGSAGSAR
jgi:hypothetical protein